MIKNFFSNQKYCILLIIYIIIITFGKLNIYFKCFEQFLWLMFILSFIYKNKEKIFINQKTIFLELIFSAIIILIHFNTGWILGFKKSPLNHQIIKMILTISSEIIPLIGIEIIRWLEINNKKKIHSK